MSFCFHCSCSICCEYFKLRYWQLNFVWDSTMNFCSYCVRWSTMYLWKNTMHIYFNLFIVFFHQIHFSSAPPLSFSFPVFLCKFLFLMFLFFSLQKQWMEWLKLWRSEASLSLLIKLSAWHPIGGTKAWNCLTFFLPVHSAISHFLSYISQWGGQREPLKIIFTSNLRICQAMCILQRRTSTVWDMTRQLYKCTNFWEVCNKVAACKETNRK